MPKKGYNIEVAITVAKVAFAEFVEGSPCGDRFSFEPHLEEPRFQGSLA